jgi:CheY-like chemotaxis protein
MHTILIVEDNVELLGLLREVLSPEYKVVTVRRGEDAVAIASRIRPDLVIMDLQLPNMNGLEAGRWLKRDLGPKLPIVVLTALAGEADSEAVLRSGVCDAFIAKPAPLVTIRGKVEELLASLDA